MKAEQLAVLVRDIARAEREGRCDAEYLRSAAELLAAALETDEAPASQELAGR